MEKQYSHPSSEARAVLQIERDRGTRLPRLRAIGRRLGRSASVLSREVRRLEVPVYSAKAAVAGYRSR